jgi:small conductance mechanosensitive channel
MPLQEKIIEFFVTYGIQLLAAGVILAAGLLVAKWVGDLAARWLSRLRIEPPVQLLLTRVVRLLVMALTLVLVAAKVGVDIAPLVAGIGVIGVGVGLAMQGVLSNLCAGLLIIFTKPFRVGEYIAVVGVEGQVKMIDLFTTRLLHTDCSQVVVPNRKIAGEILHNYGSIRQLELKAGVAYGTNLDKLETTVRNLLRQNRRVLPQPAPVFGIESFGDSQMVLSIKPWVNVDDYICAQVELNRAIVDQFQAQNIQMPIPQREIRLINGVSAGS